MTKKSSIDLVGRLAERLDLNALAEAEDAKARVPEIAHNILPEPTFAAAPEPVVIDRAAERALHESPCAPVSESPPSVVVARAADAAALDLTIDPPTARETPSIAPKSETPTPVNAASIGLEWSRLYREGYLTPQNQSSLTAEEFRIIKRPLLRMAFNRDGTQRRLGHVAMVTSPCPGDGKTFTSINLGLSIASERDLHVLLIDCDIRRMGLSRSLGLADRPGLMDLLTQPHLTFQDVAVRTSVPNLTIIPAGRPVEGSTEIFASQAMTKFARDVAGRYRDRFVIYDTPPVLASSEAGVLASLVGQVVVVVKANETRKRSVAEAVSMFDPTTPMNFVLNKTSQSASPDRFGYYEYYSSASDT